jgi:hypothetical protein
MKLGFCAKRGSLFEDFLPPAGGVVLSGLFDLLLCCLLIALAFP